jgi:hypothetical protein
LKELLTRKLDIVDALQSHEGVHHLLQLDTQALHVAGSAALSEQRQLTQNGEGQRQVRVLARG